MVVLAGRKVYHSLKGGSMTDQRDDGARLKRSVELGQADSTPAAPVGRPPTLAPVLDSPDGKVKAQGQQRSGKHSPRSVSPTPKVDWFSAAQIGEDLLPLETVLCTAELAHRPSREPDYKSDCEAMSALAQKFADSPKTIFQTFADSLLQTFNVGSAGISLLSGDGRSFFWPAIAGRWKTHIGGSTPRKFGPSGDVLDRNSVQLFRYVQRHYAYLSPIAPAIEESLVSPFYVNGKAVGTVWLLVHDEHRKFDAEDVRQLESFSRFASTAYQGFDSHNRTLALSLENVQARKDVDKLGTELLQSALLYYALFDSIDESICIVEQTEGDAHTAKDFRCVHANPAFERQSGSILNIGKSLHQLAPDESEKWTRMCDAVLRTGVSVRFESSLTVQGRVFELHFFRVEDATLRRIGISFKDVSERTQSQSYLLRNYETFSRHDRKGPVWHLRGRLAVLPVSSQWTIA